MWPGDSQSVRRRRDTRQGSKMFLLLIQLTTLTDYYHRRSVAWPGEARPGRGVEGRERRIKFVSGFSCPPQVHI